MTAYTSINLPFAALSTEISQKTAIRTRLNAARFTGSIIAGLTGLIIAGIVLGSEGSANNEYFLMGKISGCIAVTTTLISCWGLAPFAKKARRPSGKIENITLQFKRIFRNKKFLKVITLYILLWCALQLMQTVALIYVEDVLKVPTDIAMWIPIPFQISALIGLQVWTRVSNKLNRISALNYGAIIWIISCTAALFLPALSNSLGMRDGLFINANNIILFTLLIFIICLIGIGASTAFLIPWSLLPDAIDEDPEKPAGLYTAWMVLIQKVGIALSVQLLGFLLYLSGYQSCFVDKDSLSIIEQCTSAQLTIRLCIGFIPSVLVIIGILVMRNWDQKPITN
jgi:GPH family glycoside/pentoside/hexuronide:cation symporter